MIKVRVPATSANIGAGFDCMGMALTLFNEVYMSFGDKLRIETEYFLPKDERNLVVVAAKAVFEAANFEYRPLIIKQINRVPCTSGMGSSAATIVAGAIAANRMIGDKLNQEQIISICTHIDGHPDNVVPAIVGGITASVLLDSGEVIVSRINTKPQFRVITATPNFELSTKKARSVLPENYSRADAIYSSSRAVSTFFALQNSNLSILDKVLDDKFHQPYRIGLIDGYHHIVAKMRELGAVAPFLSGAGPTIAAFCGKDFVLPKFALDGWCFRLLDIDRRGARVID